MKLLNALTVITGAASFSLAHGQEAIVSGTIITNPFDNAQNDDQFSGYTVMALGDTLFMGNGKPDKGEFYVYKKQAGAGLDSWTLDQTVLPPDGTGYYFGTGGFAVDPDYPNRIMVGYRPSMYMYELNQTTGEWAYSGKKATQPSAPAQSCGGVNMFIKGNLAFCGSNSENNYLGAVYVFRYENDAWALEQKIETTVDDDGYQLTNSRIGAGGAIYDDNTIFIGTYSTDKVYRFTFDGTTWNKDMVFKPPDGGDHQYPDVGRDYSVFKGFGWSVAAEGDTLLIGAPYHNQGNNPGGVYRWALENGTWTYKGKMQGVTQSGDYFGSGIQIRGSDVAIVAVLDDEKGTNAGAFYHYALSNGSINFQAKYTPSGLNAGDSVGQSSMHSFSGMGEVEGSGYVAINNRFHAYGGWRRGAFHVVPINATYSYNGNPSPSKAPTKTPTPPPTNSPTRTPWDIEFLDMVANFTSTSEEELKLTYRVGSGRTFAHSLKAGGCASSVDMDLPEGEEGYTVTPSTAAGEGGFDILTLDYNFNKSAIANSNIWNTGEKEVELCQVVQLTLPGTGNSTMIISEVKSNVTIAFDLNANFSLADGNAVDLDGATILANSTNTTLDDYILAYKCESIGAASTGEDLKLVPNKELKVCIKSSSSDVEIESVDSMVITGTTPIALDGTTSSSTLPVIDSNGIIYSDITTQDIKNDRTEPEAIITTFVPPNMFDYEAPTGAKIDVSGSITVKLASGTRKLMLGRPDRLLQAEEVANLFDTDENNAAFDVVIDLQPEEDIGQFEEAMMSSANDIFGKVFGIVMAAVGIIALW